jgi:hypothetical protein
MFLCDLGIHLQTHRFGMMSKLKFKTFPGTALFEAVSAAEKFRSQIIPRFPQAHQIRPTTKSQFN